METTWFCLLALVAAVYGALDGYDLGVGILYPFVAKTQPQREEARQTILPVWDGNEVWLIAGGAILFFAFPRAYAASFAGFYLAFFVLLWLLVPRGLALELRGKVDSPLWRDFCDGAFFSSSVALAFVFGVALGNVLRGVPLDASGYFFVPFWTIMGRSTHPGVFDWYTVLVGVGGIAILIVHGGAFLAARSHDLVRQRALDWVRRVAPIAVILTAAAAVVTPVVNKTLLRNYREHPAAYLFPAAAAVAALAMVFFAWRRRERETLIASSALIFLVVGSAAMAMYPMLLIPTTDNAYALTIYNSAATHYALKVGLVWGGIGLLGAAGYSIFAHYLFRGRVTV